MAAVIDVRSRVLNGLAKTTGPLITAIDELEAASESGDAARVRRAGTRLYKARDSYLKPIIERAEEGGEW